MTRPGRFLDETRKAWATLNLYGRFEQVVALTLTVLISVVILIALFRLAVDVYKLVLEGAIDPFRQQTFQLIFGGIMTVLIALEFNHSILKVSHRRNSIVHVDAVLLIAMLALARKFIILDVHSTPALSIAAVALSMLALGAVYWLVRRTRATQPARNEPAEK